MAINDDTWKLVDELRANGYEWELDGTDGIHTKFTIFDGVFHVELHSATCDTAEEAIRKVYDKERKAKESE